MGIIEEIAAALPEGKIEDIRIGEHWTAVVVDVDGQRRCGLASVPHDCFEKLEAYHREIAALKTQNSARELARMAARSGTPLASVGMACLNALIPPRPESWTDVNAGEMIAEKGRGKRVALVGHFPFIEDLKTRVGELNVLELHPRAGDLPAEDAPRILPHADVVAITSMAFINGTMPGLLELCAPHAYVIVLGPSTPLSPVLFGHGIHMLCGSVVEKIGPVVEKVAEGAGFREIQHHGVRLVTMLEGET